MSVKSNRENDNLRSSKSIKLSNEKQIKTVAKTTKTPQKHAPKFIVPVAKLSLTVSKDKETTSKAKNTQSKTKISASSKQGLRERYEMD